MKTFFLAFVALDAATTLEGLSGSAGLPDIGDMGKMMCNQAGLPDIGDFEKVMCNQAIYLILAGGDPKKYPLSGPLKPVKKGSYSSSGGTCTVTQSGASMTI